MALENAKGDAAASCDEARECLIDELRCLAEPMAGPDRPGYFQGLLERHGAATLTWAVSQARPDGPLEVIEGVREAPCLTRPMTGPLERLGFIALDESDAERAEALATALEQMGTTVRLLECGPLVGPSPEPLAALAARCEGLDAVIAPLTAHRALPYALLLARLEGRAAITIAPSHDHPLRDGLVALPRLLAPATLSHAVWVGSEGSLPFWQEATHGRALALATIPDARELMGRTREVCATPIEIVDGSGHGPANPRPIMAVLMRAGLGGGLRRAVGPQPPRASAITHRVH